MTWFKQNWIAAVTWLSVFIGFVLRSRQYFIGRSLWLDEASLALNIVERSFSQLTKPLDHVQGAPLLFLWVEKLLATLLSNDEYVLRLLPFIAGITALLLFPLISNSYQAPRAAMWGTILFAFAEPLIYYTSEVKQYSSDILITLLALALFLVLKNRQLRPLDVLWLGAAGPIMIWISHPAVFSLASAGLIALFLRIRSKERFQIIILLAIGAIWVAAFAANLLLSLENLANNQILLDFWQGGFPPQAGGITAIATWIYERYLDLFSITLETTFAGAVAILYLFGLIVMARRRWTMALSLFLPLLLTMAAALLSRFPFFGRLMLFSIPLLLIPIADGLDRLLIWPKGRRAFEHAGLLLVLFFLTPTVLGGLSFITEPNYGEDIEPAIHFIYEKREPDDPVYLYFASRNPYDYYSEWYPIPDEHLIRGKYSRQDWQVYRQTMEQLSGEHTRLWLLFSHVYTGGGGSEETIILDALEEYGWRQETSITTKGARAYLYSLSP